VSVARTPTQERPASAGPIEIQFHPADPRRPPRRWRIEPKRLRWLRLALFAYLGFLAAGALGAPFVLPYVGAGRLQAAHGEHARQARELQALAERVERLQESERRLDERLGKLAVAYELRMSVPAATGLPRVPKLPAGLVGQQVTRIERGLEVSQRGLELGAGVLDRLEALRREDPAALTRVPSVTPLPLGDFVLVSPFGLRKSPFTGQEEHHNGLTLAALAGTSVRAPARGRVLYAGSPSTRSAAGWWKLGTVVVLDHGGGLVTVYGHLAEVTVRAGQEVPLAGELGRVGKSGWAPNPQLYYEVRRPDAAGVSRPIDPRFFITDHSWDDETKMLELGPATAADGSFEPLP
jgi:murein DD-endopeptidase MepM/ murein hydrolase activator NlpD